MVDENQRFGSRDASIFKVEDAHFNLEDGGGTTSETLVSNHHTTLRNKPEDWDFYVHRREDKSYYKWEVFCVCPSVCRSYIPYHLKKVG